jgi:hypothetical protein
VDATHSGRPTRDPGHDFRIVGAMSLTVRAMEPADLPIAAAVGAAGMGFELEGEAEERRWQERIGYLLGRPPRPPLSVRVRAHGRRG